MLFAGRRNANCVARQPANPSRVELSPARRQGVWQCDSSRRRWRADHDCCGAMSFERARLKPITQFLPDFILIKADQAHTAALHNTIQAVALEMAEQAPGSEVVATRLAEVLFIQVLRAHIASGTERNKGWLRAIFDPQIGNALGAIHDRVDSPWTVESIATAAGMSRSGFAARFKELLGQTPLEYVTEWRMQKAMQLLDKRDKKLIEIARSVGYDSDAAFSKAFKRVVGSIPVTSFDVVT
ncbi:MAG: AraC family transcriptional regulator [Janthinobacterium lividum]